MATNLKIASTTGTGGKREWPELVGNKGEEARAKIMEENPLLKPQTVNEGSFVTCDLRHNRVRVYVDDQGVVTAAPKIG